MTSTSMEVRLVAMEQLVEKLTTEVGVLQKKNESLKGTTNELSNDVEPSNNKHVGSKNSRGEGDLDEERRDIQNELCNLKGKY